jgi:hypothetical protein
MGRLPEDGRALEDERGPYVNEQSINNSAPILFGTHWACEYLMHARGRGAASLRIE